MLVNFFEDMSMKCKETSGDLDEHGWTEITRQKDKLSNNSNHITIWLRR
jgi:hypothetical protein